MIEHFSIPWDGVSDSFQNARKLLDEPGTITVAASSDSRTRTVKISNGIQPIIVNPSTKNRDILTFICGILHVFEFCQHTLAVSADNNTMFEDMSE